MFRNLRTRSCSFSLASGLAFQAYLKETEAKLELLIDVHMLLIVEICIGNGIYHTVHRYAKTNNKYVQNYDPNIQ